MALNQLDEALGRINAVLESERERLAAKNQELAKVNWDRHQARLESALLPGCSRTHCDRKRFKRSEWRPG